MTPAMTADLVDALGQAFKSGDITAVLQCFAADGDVVYVGSEVDEVAFGASALTSLLEKLFARDERYSWQSRDVYVHTCTTRALVVAEALLTVHAVADGATIETGLPYQISGVLEQTHGRWAWRLWQGVEPGVATRSA